MRLSLILAFSVVLTGCAGRSVPLNADFSAPTSAGITRGFALRDRYEIPKHIGRVAIFMDSVSVHLVHIETSTVVWKDDSGRWQWSQISETWLVGFQPLKRTLQSDESRPLSAAQSKRLDRLIADRSLYSSETKATGPIGIGTPGHVMSIVTPFGRTTISWEGRLEGVGGTIADIVLGTD